MLSKNFLAGALLVWAAGATLLTLMISRKAAFSPQCDEQQPNMPSGDIRRGLDTRDQDLSLGGVSRGATILSSEDDMNANQSEVGSTRKIKILPISDRVNQFDGVSTAQIADSVISKEIPKHLRKYVVKIFQPMSDVDDEEFTMIMLTYKRVKILSQLITHYCGTKKLHKLLVIWNDVDSAIPQSILDLTQTCQTRLEFVKEKENKLTNRFKPRSEIETECVCIIDDDRLLSDIRDLEGAFTVWQSFRERIIGYEVRSYTLQRDGSFFYGQYDQSKPYPGYSIMGTGTAILHKAYLEMFFDPKIMPPGMLDYVDKGKNCEDLAMNVLATKFLEDVSWHQPAALSYKPKGQIKNMEALAYEPGGHRGLSMRPDHYRQRTQCLNKFAEFFRGQLPLHYTFIRVFIDETMS